MRLGRLLPLVLAAGLAACGGSPPQVATPASQAFADTGGTALAQRVEALGNPRDGRSGVRLVGQGTEALALRLILSRLAERSIDAQYYILHDDVAGHLFTGELLRAADRGVRVRLLLDDMYTADYDAMSAALTRHPNIEIRLFNPFRRDIGRLLGSVFDFGRINRRMHNKSMTFDNQVTIVGGRNIGAEYFAADEGSNYDDLDLLAAGPVVRDVSAVFDEYWNSPYAVPAEVVIGEPPEALPLEEARSRMMRLYDAARETEYGQALTHQIVGEIRRGRLGLDWVPAEVEADPPEKAAGDTTETLTSSIAPLLLATEQELVVASAYFVPGRNGTALLTSLARQGVRVVVLTNSLESNDVEPVHGHYARYRKDLLEAGVELWELRPDRPRPDRTLLELGQSLSGLHSKAFAVDARHLFVGSFNWDPRSVGINTEMGILVDGPGIAREAVNRLKQGLPEAAYRLRLDAEGQITWSTRRPDGTWIVHEEEPSSSFWRRFRTRLYGLLPIEGQL